MGRFSFGRVGAGIFSLKAVHPDHAHLYRPDVVVAGDQTAVDLGTFTLSIGGTLEGKVTGAGGQPVEGAEVEIRRYGGSQDPPVYVRTGPDGVFRARGLRFGELFYIRAWRRGYLPWKRGYAPGGLDAVQLRLGEPVRIELKPLRSLSGRVVNLAGEPVAGAAVRTGLVRWDFRPYVDDFYAVTDAEGRFRLEGFPASFEVSADGYNSFDGWIPEGEDPEDLTIVLQPLRPAQRQEDSATSTLEEKASAVELPAGTGETQVELHLPPSVEVSGRVLGADGRGIPGTGVQMWAMPEKVATFPTEADGSFLIPRVPDGRYRLRAWRRDGHGKVRDEDEVEITVKGQPVRGVKLRFGGEEPEATVSGHIRGVAPADLSRVWIVAADSRNHLGGILDSRGTYRIPGLYPGEWKLEAGAPNGKAEARLHISPGQTEATLDLEIQPLKGTP